MPRDDVGVVLDQEAVEPFRRRQPQLGGPRPGDDREPDNDSVGRAGGAIRNRVHGQPHMVAGGVMTRPVHADHRVSDDHARTHCPHAGVVLPPKRLSVLVHRRPPAVGRIAAQHLWQRQPQQRRRLRCRGFDDSRRRLDQDAHAVVVVGNRQTHLGSRFERARRGAGEGRILPLRR